MSLRVFDITFITWRESLFMAEWEKANSIFSIFIIKEETK
jgi:hypothetical protein